MALGENDSERRIGSARLRSSVDEEPGWGYRLGQFACQGLLLLLVAVVPWFFGGVYANAQVYCAAALGLALCGWICLLPGRQQGNETLPMSIAPLLVALLIPLWQLWPLGPSAIRALAPRVAAWRETLLIPPTGGHDLPPVVNRATTSNDAKPVSRAPISLYPSGTRRRAALLVMGVAAFALGSRFFRRREPLLALISVTAVCGVALAFFGILQKLSWRGMIYGIYPLINGGNPFGPYINRNNAAGFLNIALGCSLGLMLWQIGRRNYRSAASEAEIEFLNQGVGLIGRAIQDLRDAIGALTAMRLALLAGLVMVVAGVSASLSRGGILAMFVGLLLACWMIRRLRGAWLALAAMVLVMIGAAAMLSFTGLAQMVEARIQSAISLGTSDDSGRSKLLDVGLRTAADYWLLGGGLGTFRYTHQPHGQGFRSVFFEYAENQYLETWAEAGMPGLSLLLAEIGLMGWVCLRLIRASQRNVENLWVSVTLLVLLATQLVQALVDFGLYYPGNFLPFALICGACAGRVTLIDAQSSSNRRWTILSGAAWLSPVIAVTLLLATCWAWSESTARAAIERDTFTRRWDDRPDALSLDEVEATIERLGQALDREPGDAVGQMRLAHMWIRRFRLLALATLQAEVTTQTAEQLWPLTDIGALHARAIQLQRSPDGNQLDQLRSDPLVTTNLHPAWRHLTAARDACPMMAEPHYYLGALCFLVGDADRDEPYLDAMLVVAPHHAELILMAGMLDFDAGRKDHGLERMRTAWEASVGHGDDVMRSVAPRLGFDELLNKVFPRNPEMLATLAETYYGGDENRSARERLARRSAEILEQIPAAVLDDERRLAIRGRLAVLMNRVPEAIELFQQCLKQRPEDLHTRLRLINELRKAGRVEEARNVAKLGLFLAPSSKELRFALSQL
ncbi:MAG: O-antigen ligase family protein [Planctomycetes bacterium]|nr:O-antigen ligase family protein [Planctomycetota bacterium]